MGMLFAATYLQMSMAVLFIARERYGVLRARRNFGILSWLPDGSTENGETIFIDNGFPISYNRLFI